MTKPTRRAALFLVAVLAGAQAQRGAHAQEKQDLPSFAAGVELITVDAVVFDSKGRLVTGLTKDDFVVTEDGKVQPIASFEAFVQEFAEEEETPVQQVEASNAPTARSAGRAFAVVVDDARMSTQRADSARGAVASFLEHAVRDGDLVILADTSGSVWWSARIPEGREDLLAVLSRVKGHETNAFSFDRMTNYEAFWISKYGSSPSTGSAPGSFSSAGSPRGGGEPLPGGVGNVTVRVIRRWAADNLCQEPSCEQLVRGRAEELDAKRRGNMKLTLAATRRALDALAPVRGRKSLLLISEGFIDDLDPEQREVAAVSREANTAVYFLDVKGILGIPAFGSASDAGVPPDPREQQTMALEETRLEAAGSEELADATGGFSVRGTNDFASGLERIAEESRRFYLLGFYPPEGKSAREWRKLKVEVKRPGLKVRARRGYTLRTAADVAPPPAKKDKSPTKVASPAMAQALDSAYEAPGIPLRAMAYVLEAGPKNTVHALVAAEVDVRGLSAPAGADPPKTRLEVSVVAVNRDTGRGFRHDDVLELEAQTGPPFWRSFVREFQLPPGVTQAHVVVRDPAKGTLGSVSQRFEVPPSGHLRITTPLLTDSIVPSKDPQGPPQPALAAHRMFRPQGGLYIQYEVIGAALDPQRGVPQVVAGIEVWAPGNKLVRKLDPTPIGVDLNARVVRQMGIALDGMPAGPYDLVLDVRDEVSGARIKQREPFVVTADVAATRPLPTPP